MITTTEAIDRIKALPHVLDARLWSRVPGKERIYVATEKCNGGRAWNGGVGYRECYVDVATARIVANGEAGAATRKMLRDTLDEMSRIAEEIDR